MFTSLLAFWYRCRFHKPDEQAQYREAPLRAAGEGGPLTFTRSSNMALSTSGPFMPGNSCSSLSRPSFGLGAADLAWSRLQRAAMQPQALSAPPLVPEAAQHSAKRQRTNDGFAIPQSVFGAETLQESSAQN